MRYWILGIFCLLLSSLRAAETDLARGDEIVAGENAAAWQTLFTALAGKGNVVSSFNEQRWFKLRQQPVELAGTMRLSAEHGLSLHYERGDRTVIVDVQGVLLRDGRGRTRTVKPDDRTPAVNTWLLPVLRFDLAALQPVFRLFGSRDAEAWRLNFVPLDPSGPEEVGTIVVHGAGEAIARIELRPQAGLRIEIGITGTQTGVVFTPAELQRYFR